MKNAAAATIDPIDCTASSPDPGSTYASARRSVATISPIQHNTVKHADIKRFINRFPSGTRLEVSMHLI
jgi:hypothetical protein